MSPAADPGLLARALDIRRWLQHDRDMNEAERLARDRAIGRELIARDPVERVLAWWARVGRDSSGPGIRVESARRLAGAALVMGGMLLGAAVGGVAFGYEGHYPINLFTLLGVLVGVPLVMLAVTLVLIPGRLPGLGAIQAVAAGMSPARWVGVALDRLLGADLFTPGLSRGGAGGGFARWQIVVFSQLLALGFFAGAIAVALLLVTFTDLAFGWSTTLDMDPARVHGWVAALSAPWAAWVPQAAPDAALVEVSRYARLDDTQTPLAAVERLGGWWPFVLMTVLVYGALPRAALLLFGGWRLRRATRALLLDDPEVTALCDRLDAPLLALGGDSEEDDADRPRTPLPGPAESSALSALGMVLIVWNAAVPAVTARQWSVRHLGVDVPSLLELGILQSEARQREHLAAARRELDAPARRVLVVTKGWEPPLLEFMDFLGLVREELGGEASITVVPLCVGGDAVRAAEREIWAGALARLRDPRLYVMPADEPPASPATVEPAG